ncbi:hypothetical protein BC629DRAFT_1567846 [Irpex lacteus]|nr:hypothetical protein BC629DRAFT_1567846 [Irpex lacteus]
MGKVEGNGFRGLKVSRTEHADHLNPESWRGDAVVGGVDLQSAWAQGREKASALLSRVHITFDFETDRSEEPSPASVQTPSEVLGFSSSAVHPTQPHTGPSAEPCRAC